MTKREIQRLETKKVIDYLIKEYDAIVEDGEGGRFNVIIGGLNGQFSRRDYDITFHESITLAGEGWTEDEVNTYHLACSLEDSLNEEIKELLRKD